MGKNVEDQVLFLLVAFILLTSAQHITHQRVQAVMAI